MDFFVHIRDPFIAAAYPELAALVRKPDANYVHLVGSFLVAAYPSLADLARKPNANYVHIKDSLVAAAYRRTQITYTRRTLYGLVRRISLPRTGTACK